VKSQHQNEISTASATKPSKITQHHGRLPYLNLGCGRRHHAAWTNIDVAPQAPGVIAYDLSQGIPQPENTFEVVYHSHLLEHMRRSDAGLFMRECCRVLKPGGVVRVAVPDLEAICRLYLVKLEDALAGDASGANDYDWIFLEMYDQTVREQTGGDMLNYLRQDPLPSEDFIYERSGEDGRKLVRSVRTRSVAAHSNGSAKFHSLFREVSQKVRYRVIRLLLGRRGMDALRIGEFRLGGEVHQWMYDRYSLAQLMRASGFVSPSVVTAATSQIPGWSSFNLDTTEDGRVNKPGSLFMEAVKPAA
jgi:predicted SAM-dependent methyltransferase